MGLSKFFLNTGEALRPVLTKIIPMKLLSKMKAGIINNATDKLSADSIEKYEAGRYKKIDSRESFGTFLGKGIRFRQCRRDSKCGRYKSAVAL